MQLVKVKVDANAYTLISIASAIISVYRSTYLHLGLSSVSSSIQQSDCGLLRPQAGIDCSVIFLTYLLVGI